MSAFARLREPAVFYSVGLVNTVVDFAAFTLLSQALGVPYLAAQVISYTTGAANSYALNRLVTFRRRGRPVWREAGRFALANAISLITASALLVALRQGLGLALVAAKALSIVLSAVLNYLVNRLWVFPPQDPAVRPSVPPPPAPAPPRPAWRRAPGGEP